MSAVHASPSSQGAAPLTHLPFAKRSSPLQKTPSEQVSSTVAEIGAPNAAPSIVGCHDSVCRPTCLLACSEAANVACWPVDVFLPSARLAFGQAAVSPVKVSTMRPGIHATGLVFRSVIETATLPPGSARAGREKETSEYAGGAAAWVLVVVS